MQSALLEEEEEEEDYCACGSINFGSIAGLREKHIVIVLIERLCGVFPHRNYTVDFHYINLIAFRNQLFQTLDLCDVTARSCFDQKTNTLTKSVAMMSVVLCGRSEEIAKNPRENQQKYTRTHIMLRYNKHCMCPYLVEMSDISTTEYSELQCWAAFITK